ncbi:hypothetical protein Ciccas_003999 [Cichlidogyrus casuarinus]|uniref:Uncharacterized protein n=1 Tax=Cichlidogyrus casuarinus TaxID=1844966 RepID=A0ABD2QCR1_9PLAT
MVVAKVVEWSTGRALMDGVAARTRCFGRGGRGLYCRLDGDRLDGTGFAESRRVAIEGKRLSALQQASSTLIHYVSLIQRTALIKSAYRADCGLCVDPGKGALLTEASPEDEPPDELSVAIFVFSEKADLCAGSE